MMAKALGLCLVFSINAILAGSTGPNSDYEPSTDRHQRNIMFFEKIDIKSGPNKQYAYHVLKNVPTDDESTIHILSSEDSSQIVTIRTAEKNEYREGRFPDMSITAALNKDNSVDSLTLGSPEDRSQTRIFFTKTQQAEHLRFPNDFTNPYNRLQPSKEELAAIKNAPTGTGNVTENWLEEPKTLTRENATLPDETGTTVNSFVGFKGPSSIATINLTLNVMKTMARGEETVIFSPLSLYNMLAVLMLGSERETLEELTKVFNIPASSNLSSFHEGFQNQLKTLKTQSKSNKISIEIANEVFTDKNYTLLDSYVRDAQAHYDTPVQSHNFEHGGKAFVDSVNEWVRNKTHGKIKTIMDEPPSPSTAMAIVNAVYFRGIWEIPFLERVTRKRDFSVKANETIQVDMMTNILSIPFIQTNSYQMAQLPYKGNETGFFIILPNSTSSLSDGLGDLKTLEAKLEAGDLLTQISNMKSVKVALSIPKMKITTQAHIKDILSNIGLGSMFHPLKANFTKISPDNGLYISAVMQKSIIEVNERGTEAAAVTIGLGDRTIEEIPILFKANKPFLFFIYHIPTKSVLFWGRVIRPQWD